MIIGFVLVFQANQYRLSEIEYSLADIITDNNRYRQIWFNIKWDRFLQFMTKDFARFGKFRYILISLL